MTGLQSRLLASHLIGGPATEVQQRVAHQVALPLAGTEVAHLLWGQHVEWNGSNSFQFDISSSAYIYYVGIFFFDSTSISKPN